LSCSLRRALNLSESWFLSVISPDAWENDYKNIFSESLEQSRQRSEIEAEWAPKDDSGLGSFVLERRENAGASAISISVSSS